MNEPNGEKIAAFVIEAVRRRTDSLPSDVHYTLPAKALNEEIARAIALELKSILGEVKKWQRERDGLELAAVAMLLEKRIAEISA